MDGNNQICPLDNRYATEISEISEIWNDDNVLWTKFGIEINYLRHLAIHRSTKMAYDSAILVGYIDKTFKIGKQTDEYKRNVLAEIRTIESTTRHEIKAIEYFIRRELTIDNSRIGDQLANYVHFGLTSEDVISITNSFLIGITKKIINENIKNLLSTFKIFDGVADCAMASRTHGQLAIPTSFGKQLQVYKHRINFITEKSDSTIYCKMGGAIGDLYSLKLVQPDFNWTLFFDNFCGEYGLSRLEYTTQVDNGLSYNHILNSMNQLCRIFIDFCQDIWLYNSYGYFIRKKNAGEIGSSTMPQKINPIKFENAEGNAKVASMWLNFLVNELPISRMQRDLSGSTIMRNLGMPFGYMLLSIKNMVSGVSNLELNRQAMQSDLVNNHELMFEYIQLILKDNGYTETYELLNNNFAKRQSISRQELVEFIDQLNINDNIKTKIRDFDITKIIK